MLGKLAKIEENGRKVSVVVPFRLFRRNEKQTTTTGTMDVYAVRTWAI